MTHLVHPSISGDAQFSETLDHIESGIMILDGAGRILFWNRWLEVCSGILAATARERTLPELFAEQVAPVLVAAVEDACHQRMSRLLSYQLHPHLLPLRQVGSGGRESPLYLSALVRPLTASDNLTLIQLHDITNAVRRERHLREKERDLRQTHQALMEEKLFTDTILKTISALVLVTDRQGCIVSLNRSFEQLTGIGQDEARGQPLRLLFNEDSEPLFDPGWPGVEASTFTSRMLNARKELIHIRWTVRHFGDPGQPPRYLIYTGQDISERERADALLRLEREMLELATAGNSPDQLLDHVCLTLERMLSHTRVAVLRLDMSSERLQVTHAPGLPGHFYEQFDALQSQPLATSSLADLQGDMLLVYPELSRDPRWQSWRSLAQEYGVSACWLMPIQTSQGGGRRLFAFFPRDPGRPSAHEQLVMERVAHLMTLILERHQQQERIRYLALYDPLTGLANRSLLTEQLLRNVHRARREQREFGLLFVDLDGFKQINDQFGHDAGDALLAALGQRFREVLRATDTSARIGGDEFVVLLESVADDQAAVQVAEKVLALVEQPVSWREQTLAVSASIGIALYPADGETADLLLTRADNAMYAAKDAGKGMIARHRNDACREAPAAD